MPIHAKLTKLSSKPNRPSGLSDGYYVKGDYSSAPEVGKPFLIHRYERNGVLAEGYLQTSYVLNVRKTKMGYSFETQNSKYRVRHLDCQE